MVRARLVMGQVQDVEMECAQTRGGISIHGSGRDCEDAISLQRYLGGQWFISQTRFGAMIHAYLQPGEENSGKLVSVLRQSAKRLARHRERGAETQLTACRTSITCL